MADVRVEMARDIAERKNDKRKNLEADHEEKLKALLEEVATVKRSGEECAHQARTAQLIRLTQLISRKTEIEHQLAATTAEVAERYSQMKKELIAALNGKMGDIEGAERVLEVDLKVKERADGDNGVDLEMNGDREGGDKAMDNGKGLVRDVAGMKQGERKGEMGSVGRRG